MRLLINAINIYLDMRYDYILRIVGIISVNY